MPILRRFRPRAGWINDPHGVLWAGGRYHLFFQHNPVGDTWAPAIHWGHAVSPDLVTWAELAPALSPAPDEVGCWTGSVVLSDRGEPTLFYTRVTEPDQRRGVVARALGDPALVRWRRDPPEPVVVPDAVECRDPYVWRAADDWRMVIGAPGALLQYRSADLRAWEYDGVIARGAGPMWECPQLFPLDGTWVLLVSVMDDVRYALGDYDGRRFTAEVWGSFAHGGPAYATTTFTDRDGRRCVISWIRGAGVLSLPWVLRVEGDLLLAEPHPNLAGHEPDDDVIEITRAGEPGIFTTRRST